MKKIISAAMTAAIACPLATNAQTKLDTTKVQNINEVVVKAVRAPKTSPFAVANIKKQELKQFATTGRELPFLFARTPGVIAWSENGVGQVRHTCVCVAQLEAVSTLLLTVCH